MRVIYEFFWQQANRVRLLLGRAVQPKRCCKREYNRLAVPIQRPDVSVTVCRVCGCRHYEVAVDPLHLNVSI